MADQKISQLNNIAGSNVAADDEFVIVDTDANETKAIRADNIRAAVGLATTDSPTFAGLTVDTNTLYVDAPNDRVGIGTTSPSAKLDVVGNAEINGALTTTGNITVDSSSNANIDIDAGAASNNGSLIFKKAGAFDWTLQDAATNRNLFLYRYVGGVYQDAPITVFNSTGNVTIANDLSVTGALSKGSGSFKIDHPLKPDTHHLVHSFVEAPQADNIYRGRVSLVGGEATVDMDEAAGLTKGTQELLNGNWQVFVQNESGWSPVRGRIEVSTLYIECQDTTSTDTVSWLAIGSRQDQHMLDTDWTDDFGRPILEPLKPEDTAPIIGNEEPVV